MIWCGDLLHLTGSVPNKLSQLRTREISIIETISKLQELRLKLAGNGRASSGDQYQALLMIVDSKIRNGKADDGWKITRRLIGL
jgi:hypothetical protein